MDRPTERPIELLIAAKNESQKYGVAKAYIINLDMTVNYFIFLHCLSSKGEIQGTAYCVWMHHRLLLQAAGVKSVHCTRNKINDEVRKLGTFIDNTIA